MSEAYIGRCAGGAIRSESRHVAAFGAADWLCLAAAPTFAIMAPLTGVLGADQAQMICSSTHGASPLNGMALMYLLMSAFHAGPWLEMISSRRNGGHRA